MATQAPPLMAKGEDWDMIVRWVMVWELGVVMLGMGDRDAVVIIEILRMIWEFLMSLRVLREVLTYHIELFVKCCLLKLQGRDRPR
jgi:hypothetical protein